jgi:hypothetical protein
MPGTTKLHFYTMPLADALSLLMADKDDLLTFDMSAADIDELLHAARVVVERHAEEVVAHYAALHDARERCALRVVHNGDK